MAQVMDILPGEKQGHVNTVLSIMFKYHGS